VDDIKLPPSQFSAGVAPDAGAGSSLKWRSIEERDHNLRTFVQRLLVTIEQAGEAPDRPN
jgi:hypothetical protein